MNKKWLILVILIVVGLGVWMYFKSEMKVSNEEVIIAKPTETKVAKSVFKFGIAADVHNDIKSLQKALIEAKNNNLRLMVIAGDLTINGTEKEMTAIKLTLDNEGVDYLVVPGNHDNYKGVWIFGEKYQSYKTNGVKLILIDNSNWRGLGEIQKKWIIDEIGECKQIKCLAVMHMPLNNLLSKHVMGEYSQETAGEASWLRTTLVENNVLTGYSGHLHYSSSYTFDGWETVLVGAISEDRNNQTPRYTQVEISKNFPGEMAEVKNQVNVLLE